MQSTFKTYTFLFFAFALVSACSKPTDLFEKPTHDQQEERFVPTNFTLESAMETPNGTSQWRSGGGGGQGGLDDDFIIIKGKVQDPNQLPPGTGYRAFCNRGFYHCRIRYN